MVGGLSEIFRLQPVSQCIFCLSAVRSCPHPNPRILTPHLPTPDHPARVKYVCLSGLGQAWPGSARPGPSRLHSAPFGLGSTRPGSARLRSARLDRAWLGSVRLGSARSGPARLQGRKKVNCFTPRVARQVPTASTHIYIYIYLSLSLYIYIYI